MLSATSGLPSMQVHLGRQLDPNTSWARVDRVAYRGIRADEPGGMDPLLNPHRGLRIDLFYNVADLAPPGPRKEVEPFKLAEPNVAAAVANRCKSYYVTGVKVAQVYFYLYEYLRVDPDAAGLYAADLNKTAFDNMGYILSQLRDLGYTIVLRFAYDFDQPPPKGAKVPDGSFLYEPADIQKHLGQLKEFLAGHAGLITVLQAGFLGAWGEWGPTRNKNIEENRSQVEKTLANDIAAIAPSTVPTQMRYPWQPQKIDDITIRAKTGFHNDFFTAGFTSNYDYYRPESDRPYWKNTVAACRKVMVDGEMPYGICRTPYDVVDCGTKVTQMVPLDGITAARRLQTMHYTTFSVTHGNDYIFFDENGQPRSSPKTSYSFPHWKTQKLTAQQVGENGLPVDPAYFHNADGQEIERTAYDYIRDHLGYRLRLTQASLGQRAAGFVFVRLDIVNDGFSAPHIPRPAYLVLLDQQNGEKTRVVTIDNGAADWTIWQGVGSTETDTGPRTQPTHTIEGELDLNGCSPGPYQLGLWLPSTDPPEGLKENPRYAVRLANGDVHWSDSTGVNVFANVEIHGPTD
jgi:hypothetical protein